MKKKSIAQSFILHFLIYFTVVLAFVVFGSFEALNEMGVIEKNKFQGIIKTSMLQSSFVFIIFIYQKIVETIRIKRSSISD